jgi:hypothetical protein
MPYEGDEHAFSDAECDSVLFIGNCMYKHEAFWVNFTSYDMLRKQDSVNVRTHPYIMVLAHEDEGDENNRHPYWYAKILGIFHVNIRLPAPVSGHTEMERMDFLWVRWFGQDRTTQEGLKHDASIV